MDYRIDIQNPFLSALQGYEQGQQIAAQQQEMQARRKAQQRQAQMQADMAEFAQKSNKTPADYQRLMMMYPEMQQQIKSDLASYNEEQRQSKINQLLPVYAALTNKNTDQAKALIEEYRIASENSGDTRSAKILGLLNDQIDIDPQGALTSSEMYLFEAIGPDKLLDLKRIMSQKKSPYQKTGAFTVRDKDTKEISVVVGSFDPNNEQLNIIKGTLPENYEIVSEIGETAGERKKREIETTGGKAAVTEAIKVGSKYAEEAKTIGTNIAALNNAIGIIEEGLSKNANLGLGWVQSKVPKLDPYAIKFQQAARELGLGVISRVTFGALSEKELELAMATAVPSTLRPHEALSWLKEKRAAQEKLKNEMDRASAFIGSQNPDGSFNTVADWKKLQLVESKNRKKAGEQYPDGTIIKNPTTGERMVKRGGQWMPIGE